MEGGRTRWSSWHSIFPTPWSSVRPSGNLSFYSYATSIKQSSMMEAGLVVTLQSYSPPLVMGPSRELSFCPHPAAAKGCESALYFLFCRSRGVDPYSEAVRHCKSLTFVGKLSVGQKEEVNFCLAICNESMPHSAWVISCQKLNVYIYTQLMLHTRGTAW